MPEGHAPRVIRILDNARDVPERELIEGVYGVDLRSCRVTLTEFKLPIDATTYKDSPEELEPLTPMRPGPGPSARVPDQRQRRPGTDIQDFLLWPATYTNFNAKETVPGDPRIALIAAGRLQSPECGAQRAESVKNRGPVSRDFPPSAFRTSGLLPSARRVGPRRAPAEIDAAARAHRGRRPAGPSPIHQIGESQRRFGAVPGPGSAPSAGRDAPATPPTPRPHPGGAAAPTEANSSQVIILSVLRPDFSGASGPAGAATASAAASGPASGSASGGSGRSAPDFSRASSPRIAA